MASQWCTSLKTEQTRVLRTRFSLEALSIFNILIYKSFQNIARIKSLYLYQYTTLKCESKVILSRKSKEQTSPRPNRWTKFCQRVVLIVYSISLQKYLICRFNILFLLLEFFVPIFSPRVKDNFAAPGLKQKI